MKTFKKVGVCSFLALTFATTSIAKEGREHERERSREHQIARENRTDEHRFHREFRDNRHIRQGTFRDNHQSSHNHREYRDDYRDSHEENDRDNHRHYRDYNGGHIVHRPHHHDHPRRVIYYTDSWGHRRHYYVHADYWDHYYDPAFFLSGRHQHIGCHYHGFFDAVATGIIIGAVIGDW